MFALWPALAHADVAVVRLGLLLPAFENKNAGYGPIWPWSPRVGVYQALQEINNKTDGVADNLLPSTHLQFAHRDSKCDGTEGLMSAIHMIQSSFDGAGVSALIGPACSSGALLAAQAAGYSHVPLIGIGKAAELSNGKAYPYFVRVVSSTDFTVVAMVDMLQHLFNYTSIAMAYASSMFHVDLAEKFSNAAHSSQLDILTKQRFMKDATQFSTSIRALKRSGARVIALFAIDGDMSRFLREAFEAGVGGEGYLWLLPQGSSALWESDDAPGGTASDVVLRERVLKGTFALTLGRSSSPTYQPYLARRRALPPTDGINGACNMEQDDDGNLLWAQDEDNNASTPISCAGYSVAQLSQDGMLDAFSYDAVFLVAHALHDLIEVQNRTAIVGSELLDTLIKRVRFQGVTGLVDLHDASADPDRVYHGDRRMGVSYNLLNYVSSAQGLVEAGSWTPCSDDGACDWSARWRPRPGVGLTYSTADNSQPPQVAALRVTVVRLGILLPMFGTENSGYDEIWPWSPRVGIYQALREINDKTDGVADDLLPSTHLQFAHRDSKCDGTEGLMGALHLGRDAFETEAVSAIVGAGCSEPSIAAAQVGHGLRIPVISPGAPIPALSDGKTYPYFMRVASSDSFANDAMVDILLRLWGYTSVAVAHTSDSFGTYMEASFAHAAKASQLAILATEQFSWSTSLRRRQIALTTTLPSARYSAQLRTLQVVDACSIHAPCRASTRTDHSPPRLAAIRI